MRVLTPVNVQHNLGVIKHNLDDVEASIREYIATYDGMVVTEETIRDGKQVVADIRKAKKALDDERKEIKKAWNKPYNEFETRVKSILALYDEPIEAVNKQLSEFEEQRIKAKRQRIKDIWAEVKTPDEIADWSDLASVYNPKWDNATYSEKDIKAEMEQSWSTLYMAYQTVKAMNHEYEAEGLKELKRTKVLMDAVNRMNALAEQARIIEERRKAKEEAERKAREEAELKAKEAERRAEEAQDAVYDAIFSDGPVDRIITATLSDGEQVTVRTDTGEIIEDIEDDLIGFDEEIKEPVFTANVYGMLEWEVEALRIWCIEHNLQMDVEEE